MKKFICSIALLLVFGCANNASKESTTQTINEQDTLEEKILITKEDAYTILIKQKLQDYLDKNRLTKTHPGFKTKEEAQEALFSVEETQVNEIELIFPFTYSSDSTKTIKTKVIFQSTIDTILTHIKVYETEINEEKITTTKISFSKISNPEPLISNQPKPPKPAYVDKFSIKDLNFTWEEVNTCDCLFMVHAKNTTYKKLYFGRFIDNTTAIIQLGKSADKYLIPIATPRSKNRKPGSFWRETYQNDHYKVELKASKTTPKVKGKYTYYIDFVLTDFSTQEVVKNIILANCRS